ncbi:hypothetical protein TYRP_015465, partial [Tyrophagus putrescentiae]
MKHTNQSSDLGLFCRRGCCCNFSENDWYVKRWWPFQNLGLKTVFLFSPLFIQHSDV